MNIRDLKRKLLPLCGYLGYGADTEGGRNEGAGGDTGGSGDGGGGGYGGGGGSDRDHGGGADYGLGSIGTGFGGQTYGTGLRADAGGVANTGLGFSRTDAGGGGGGGGGGGYVSRADPYSFTKPTSYGDIAALNAAGYGEMEGFNPNNPTQTAQQIANAGTAHGFLNEYAPMLPSLMGVPPGVMTIFNAAKGLASGQTTIGSTVVGAGLSALAGKLGVPAGTLSAMLAGNFGKAAAQTATQGLMGAIAGRTGISGMVLGAIGKETGLTNSLYTGVQNAINSALGDTSTGFDVGALARIIDGAIGTTAKTHGVSVPDLNNQFDPSATLGHYLPSREGGRDSAPAAAPLLPGGGAASPQQPVSLLPGFTRSSGESPGADVYGEELERYDPFGESMFQAPKTPKHTAGTLKYLYDGGLVTGDDSGGTILEYLRS